MTADATASRESVYSAEGQDLRLFMVAGEHSGDALGAKLMAALNERRRGRMRYLGVGGAQMAAAGPRLAVSDRGRGGDGAGAILAAPAQASCAASTARRPRPSPPSPTRVVIIDSPEFTHPIARRIRRRRPEIPIIDYVSPSVWAWRPGRARKMRAYVDHVLALLPFEPEAHERLGGPPCTYVGHPLIERLRLDRRRSTRRRWPERLGLPPDTPLLVVLPGSRPSEVRRLMQPFGETLAGCIERGPEVRGRHSGRGVGARA